MTKTKQQYIDFCEATPDIPIFMQPFWLDAVCQKGEIWDAALAFDGEKNIIGAMTYCHRRKFGLPVIVMPPLTQFVGPWLRYPLTEKLESRYSFEKKVLKELIGQLPSVFYSSQSFHYSLKNWLPFYWLNYEQTTRYTYVFEDLSDLKIIYQNFKDKLRNAIRRAEKSVTIEILVDISAFYEVNKKTFDRQNIPMPYSFDFIKKLDNELTNRNLRTIYFAKDKVTGENHGVIYVVRDAQSAYCIMIGGDTQLRTSGAIPLLLWTAIQDAAPQLIFDFEGTMIQGVENLFSSFGATQMPYFTIHKCKNKWVEMARIFLLKRL